MKLSTRILLGSALILSGLAFLLQNLKILALGGLVWAGLFAFAGGGFLTVFLMNREQWWAAIPGLILLGISSIIALNAMNPRLGGLLSGSIILGTIGLGFLLAYVSNRANWWAIIPSGVLFSIAFMVGLEGQFSGIAFAGVFFLGLGLTFGLLWLLPTPEGRQGWAIYPAGILILIGFLVTAFSMRFLNLLWPTALILLGFYLIIRAVLSTRVQKEL